MMTSPAEVHLSSTPADRIVADRFNHPVVLVKLEDARALLEENRLVVKLDDAAQLCGVSRRTMYRLIETNPDFKTAVVDLGLRGIFLSVEQLRIAIRRLTGI